jgi:aspartyl protease family protein
MVWGFLFLGVIAGYGLWDDIRQDHNPRQLLVSSGVVEVPQAPDGHFYLTLEVNDTPIQFVVDTGATDIVLSKEDAADVGLNPEDLNFFGRANTANGEVSVAPTTLREVTLGDIRDVDVRASVNGGEMKGSLLGMRYLNRFSSIEIGNGTLRLTR